MALPITWTQYYDIITPSTPSIARGERVPFSMDGAHVGGTVNNSFISYRVDDSLFAFNMQAPSSNGYSGKWRISWQVPVETVGQLALQYGIGSFGGPVPVISSLIETSVVGNSWGHSQIIGDVVIYAGTAGSVFYFAIANAGRYSNQIIKFLSSGAGSENLTTTLTVQYLV